MGLQELMFLTITDWSSVPHPNILRKKLTWTIDNKEIHGPVIEVPEVKFLVLTGGKVDSGIRLPMAQVLELNTASVSLNKSNKQGRHLHILSSNGFFFPYLPSGR